MNIFERAVREKTRFAFKGSIGVEELWDLSLTNLDTIYGNLETELEGLPKKSLLSTNSKQREEIKQHASLLMQSRKWSVCARTTGYVLGEFAFAGQNSGRLHGGGGI